MPDVDSNALRRAKTLREEINARTGIADTTVTEGVKRLLRSSGNEVAIQHEAAMHLDIYPDPVIAKEEFARMMDYGDEITIGHYRVTEETRYIQLKYLENAGYAKVDTGFIPDTTTDKMHIKYEITDYRTNGVWPGIAKVQTRGNGRGNNFGINYYTSRSSTAHLGSTYEGKTYDIWTGAGITTESLVDDGITISGDHVESTTSDPLTKTLQLYYRNTNDQSSSSSDWCGRIRIYLCEIYRNDVLIHNYIPKVKFRVRIVENLDTGHIDEYILSEIYGFHDAVTDDFFTGTGDALRKGPYIITNESDYILKPLEYLHFTSSQVIYTDFVIQANQKLVIDINMGQDYGSGISNHQRSGKSNSVINTRVSGGAGVGAGNIHVGFANTVQNQGRGTFILDYLTGDWQCFEHTGTASSGYGMPNFWWYMFGAWYEIDTEYYHMTSDLYSFELYDNSTTKVKDMKPMEITTKGGYVINCGLYDSINKLLYVAGKGTLQKGPYIN